MILSRITFFLFLASSFLLLPVPSASQTTLPCFSSFQFVPGKYATCVPLKFNSTLAWSLQWDPAAPARKYLSALYTSTATKPGGWIAVGFNLADATYYMLDAAIFACYNSVNGPIIHQLYTATSLGYTVRIDTTKKRLNVTGKRCSIETINVNGVITERIYIQFNVTLGSKAKYVNQYAKGTCTALGKGVGGTAMNQHSFRWTDDDLRDFRNTSFPGKVEPPRQPSVRPPPSKPPPRKPRPLSPPPRSPPPKAARPPLPPPPKRLSPPPKRLPPTPKRLPPPPPKGRSPLSPKAHLPPPPKAHPSPSPPKAHPPPKARPPPTLKAHPSPPKAHPSPSPPKAHPPPKACPPPTPKAHPSPPKAHPSPPPKSHLHPPPKAT